MSYQESFVEVIETNETKKPNSPQITIRNPLKKTIFVNSIQLSFDAYFSEKGVIIVKINNNIILNQKPAGSYRRIHNFPIPMKNQEFLQQQKIEVYAWNGSGDTDFVNVGIDIQISEDPDLQIGNDTPLSETLRNQQISESLILFPQIARTEQTDTVLIDMKGNKKLRVFISGADYVSPTVTFGGAGIADGNILTNGTVLNGNYLAGEELLAQVDFGSIDNRNIECIVRHENSGTGVWTARLYYSVNGVDWTLIELFDFPINQVYSKTMGGLGDVSCRHAKITIDWTSGSITGNSFNCRELYDSNIFGGTSALSFEQLNIASNLWQTVIPSSEFSTLSQGQEIVAEIGDVNTVSISGKTYALPSTQNQFRAKLTTTGSIANGISAMRVS